MVSVKELKTIANIFRRDVLKMTTKAGSGHPTSCMSAAEIMAVLFFSEMKYDNKDPFNADNDEFILSKGHAAPILYSCLYHANCIKSNLMDLRKLNSPLEGHPMPGSLSWIKVATGSLGQGLSVGVGMAIAAKLQKRKYMTYVLLGDSEVAEGSVYEAFELASYYKLNNLVAIIDVNRLGQSGQTMLGHDILKYKKRFEGFGWNTIIVNGHNVRKLINAVRHAKMQIKRPTVIIARTLKGKGVNFLENKEGWHGKIIDEENLNKALKQIPDKKFPKVKILKPKKIDLYPKPKYKLKNTNYKFGELIATRDAYGKALANLAKSNPLIIATDGEVKNSTKSQSIISVDPKRFVEGFVAEQNVVGMALGLSVKGFNVFASTFAAFFTRAHDQIRMAALSSSNLTLCGSHCGVSIGEDGPSQMGLEDIGMFRCLPGSIVFYPSDAVSAEKLTYLCSKLKGIKYIRTTRGNTHVIYSNKEEFKLGDFKIVKKGSKNKVILVGSGVTLHECLNAAEKLNNVAVVDLYCLKPFDFKKFINFVKRNGRKVVVVEDHYKEGGIGDMLSSGLISENIKFRHLCVNETPHSGTDKELLHKYKIDSSAIINEVKKLIKKE